MILNNDYFMIGLTICGANCLLSADYKSASKIIARTGQSQPGKGDVIVSTRSGGVGSCTVQFKSVMVVPGRLISFYLQKKNSCHCWQYIVHGMAVAKWLHVLGFFPTFNLHYSGHFCTKDNHVADKLFPNLPPQTRDLFERWFASAWLQAEIHFFFLLKTLGPHPHKLKKHV